MSCLDLPPLPQSSREAPPVYRWSDAARLADDELMRLAARGDARALEHLYARHAAPAFSLAYRIVGDRAIAEEVSQEAFLAVWGSARRYMSERGSVRTWTLGIVRNRAIDALRRGAIHRRRRASADGLDERLEAPDRTDVEVQEREEARAVRRALEDIPSEQRRTVELAYFDGRTHREIAGLLDLPVGTVKGRLGLGLDKLRQALAAEAA